MSLERKDVRAKLDPAYHEALARLADRDQIDISEFVERAVVQAIDARVHDAIETASLVADLGFSGKNRELPGMNTGRGRK